MTHEERQKLEIERGQQVLAQRFISQQFNPEHVEAFGNEGPSISQEERKRRDEYRKYLGAWKRIHEPNEP